MGKPRLVGVHGVARSGKDTVGTILTGLLEGDGLSSKIMHFADPIKESAKIVMDWTDEHVYGDLKDKVDDRWGISPRQFLQFYGTDMMQLVLRKVPGYKHDRAHWVELLMATAEKADVDVVIIPDVRFDHEASRIKSLGGLVIKVYDPNSPKPTKLQKLLSKLFRRKKEHVSESGISREYIDISIPNLKKGIDDLIEVVQPIYDLVVRPSVQSR